MPVHRLHRASRPRSPSRDAEEIRRLRHDPDAAQPGRSSYLSFEKTVLPVAVERGLGIQAMKSTANAGLLGESR